MSADYATSDTVENELLRSFRDIDLIFKWQMILIMGLAFSFVTASAKGELKISNLISDLYIFKI